jgi:hypothetical protein
MSLMSFVMSLGCSIVLSSAFPFTRDSSLTPYFQELTPHPGRFMWLTESFPSAIAYLCHFGCSTFFIPFDGHKVLGMPGSAQASAAFDFCQVKSRVLPGKMHHGIAAPSRSGTPVTETLESS